MSMLQKMVIAIILSIGLLGCGKENTDIPNTEEVESVQDHSEIAVEEIDTKEELSVENIEIEESIETEAEQNTDTNPMVDWETFAAQEDNEEICLAISNEKMSVQKVLFGDSDSVSTCFYQYMEGDKVAVPLRDNMQRVCYYVAEADGTQKGDIKDVYWKDDIINLPYVEIEIGNEAQYYISIFDDADNKYTFGLYK